jgi:tetratricopeptide (TPR) repeat protein
MAEPDHHETLTRIAGLARSGRMDAAAAMAAVAVDGAPGDVALLALAGAIASYRGDAVGALRYLRPAHALRSDDVVIRSHLAEALFGTGDEAGALALCDDASARHPHGQKLARLGGNLAQAQEDHERAVSLYRIVVEREPGDWASWNNLGNALSALDRLNEAVAALTEAVKAAPDAPPIQLNLGVTLLQAGRTDEALAVLNRAIVAFSDDPHPHLALFRHYGAIGHDEAAFAAIAEAARRAPERADIQADFGHVAGQRNEFVTAEAAFERALTATPDFTAAIVGLASLLERVNREDELDALHERATAAGAEVRALAFIDALRLKRGDQFAAALTALDTAGDVLIPALLWQLRGQILDRLGRYDEAFAAFAAMNAAWFDDASQPRRRAADYREAMAQARDVVTPEWVAQWSPAPAATRRSPVFLVGFPRSGTTLLDTMLMAAPSVQVLEEEPFIADIERELGGVAALAGLSQVAIVAARDRYFALAGAVVPLDGDTILVDKHPMHLAKVPLIRRLFPDARFILAMRHPLDVVLSCFITNFRLNDAMANFLDLGDAVALYDQTFGAWEQARACFAPDVVDVRYEDLVAGPQRVLRQVFAALDLPWPDGEFDHQIAARERGVVRTASYAQVTQPVYARAAGRWRHYAAHLQAAEPVLAPWIARYGYGGREPD